MSDSDGAWRLQISPKLPDGTLINLRAETPEELSNMLGWIQEHAQEIVAVPAALHAAANASNAGLTSPSQPVQQAPAPAPQHQSWGQPAPQQNTGPAPSCAHGPMKFVPGGISKRTQNPYPAFWSCNGPRDQQCDSQNAA